MRLDVMFAAFFAGERCVRLAETPVEKRAIARVMAARLSDDAKLLAS